MLNETVIVTALRNGNVRRALELMLDSYQDELFSYCARLVGFPGATLVYNRVLATAIHDLSRFSNRTSVRAWLFSIARRAVIGHHRANHADHPGARRADYRPVCGREPVRPYRVKDPEVAECIEELEVELREVLQLSLWHGLHLREIAHVVGAGEGEIRDQATRGLLSIASQLRLAKSPPS